MKIGTPKTIRTEKWLVFPVEYKKKKFEISVIVWNGKLKGESCKDAIATSYLTYFHETPEHIRQRHFLKIKKLIEKH